MRGLLGLTKSRDASNAGARLPTSAFAMQCPLGLRRRWRRQDIVTRRRKAAFTVGEPRSMETRHSPSYIAFEVLLDTAENVTDRGRPAVSALGTRPRAS